jgi:hypothetical protein
MASYDAVEHLTAVLAARDVPTVTVWNRLEGRPRTVDFERALRAEVRDALWMLTRQWQVGELRGSDAGSLISARLLMRHSELTTYRPREHDPEPLPADLPLEAAVERRPVALPLSLRAMMGRHWLRLLGGIGDYASEYLRVYRFSAPDPTDPDAASLHAHPAVWQAHAAAAGRLVDGGALYEHLTTVPGARATDEVTVDPGDAGAIDQLGEDFVRWFERLILPPPPATGDAWDAQRLEYRFACSAPEESGRTVLAAEGYAGGGLDWPSFDVAEDDGAHDPAAPTADPGREPRLQRRGLVPVTLSFAGMPNARWWAFEDGRTNLGDVRPETTELGKLLLLEVALVYGNDWYLVPHTLPVGSLARVAGLAVTTVFGERRWIEAAGRGADTDWQRWGLFGLGRAGSGGDAEEALLVAPAAATVLEGEPFEEIALMRDELANMVWGVERTILTADGEPRRGSEAADELRATLQRLRDQGGVPVTAPPPVPVADMRYRTTGTVPENWIPFVPSHSSGQQREIQLQRGAMLRVFERDAQTERIAPRTSLLGVGFADGEPYFINEEEVPRAGVVVQQSFRRTRWLDGRVYVWVGARKRTGRGEGSSGLAFDTLSAVPEEEQGS